jgi:hypothetical protein
MYTTGQTQAVHQIQPIENGQVTVRLPADFPTQRAEIFVFPVRSDNDSPGSKPNLDLLQRILAWDTSNYDIEQMRAYQRLCALIAKGRKPDEPRVFGTLAGLVWLADDFNIMSEEDLDLFYADISTNTSNTKSLIE